MRSLSRRDFVRLTTLAMGAVAVPPIAAEAASPGGAPEGKSQADFWQALGKLPLPTSSLTSDGISLYAASGLAGKLVRAGFETGKLGSPESLTWPGRAGQEAGIALGGWGLYGTVLDAEGTTAHRSDITPGRGPEKTWRPVVRLQSTNDWTCSHGIADRIWISHAGRNHYLHYLEAPRPGKSVRREFEQGVYLGAPRPRSAFAATARFLYVIGGIGSEKKVTAVPIVNGRLDTPRELSDAPVPMVDASAAVHGSQLYVISVQSSGPRVDRATIEFDGRLTNWTRLVSPSDGARPTAAASIDGSIVIARADGSIEALPVASVSPGLRHIVWHYDGKSRLIEPDGKPHEMRIPWSYNGPEEIDDFSAWSYATGRASRLADQASLAGTTIQAGGGTGRELKLVITVPKGSRRRDYWSIILLKSRGRSIGRILRVHHVNTACGTQTRVC